MAQRTATIASSVGLHARPAALFVQEANKYASEIFVQKGDKKVNAKSIMGIMSLAVAKGTEIVISADGPDAEKAVEALAEMVNKEEV